MSEEWQYQVRIDLADELAEMARHNPADPALAPLPDDPCEASTRP